mgnify:CR=1 FL=1
MLEVASCFQHPSKGLHLASCVAQLQGTQPTWWSGDAAVSSLLSSENPMSCDISHRSHGAPLAPSLLAGHVYPCSALCPMSKLLAGMSLCAYNLQTLSLHTVLVTSKRVAPGPSTLAPTLHAQQMKTKGQDIGKSEYQQTAGHHPQAFCCNASIKCSFSTVCLAAVLMWSQ